MMTVAIGRTIKGLPFPVKMVKIQNLKPKLRLPSKLDLGCQSIVLFSP